MNVDKIKEFLTMDHFKMTETFGKFTIDEFDSISKGKIIKIMDSKSFEEVVNISEKWIKEANAILEALAEFVDETNKTKNIEIYVKTNYLKMFWDPMNEFVENYRFLINQHMPNLSLEQMEHVVYVLDRDILKISKEFLDICTKISMSSF